MKSIHHAKISIFLTVTAVIAFTNAFQQQHHVALGKYSTLHQRGTSEHSHYAISSPTLDNRISPIMGDYNDQDDATPSSELSPSTPSSTTHRTPSTMTYLEACRTLTTSILSRIGHVVVSDTMLSPRKHLSQMLLIVVTQVVLQDVQWRMLRLAALLTIKLPVYAIAKHKRMRLANRRHTAVSITDLPSREEHETQNTTLRQLAFSELGQYLLGTYCLEW